MLSTRETIANGDHGQNGDLAPGHVEIMELKNVKGFYLQIQQDKKF